MWHARAVAQRSQSGARTPPTGKQQGAAEDYYNWYWMQNHSFIHSSTVMFATKHSLFFSVHS
jgi:hypothetical protein